MVLPYITLSYIICNEGIWLKMGIKSGMIANELQLVEEVLSGKKDIPEYFTIKENK